MKLVDYPIVKSVMMTLPEFYTFESDTESAPVRRSGDFLAFKAGFNILCSFFECLTILNRSTLFAGV